MRSFLLIRLAHQLGPHYSSLTLLVQEHHDVVALENAVNSHLGLGETHPLS
jgi:hypothetical protein